jgi:flavin reductase (DIM6/NTAB) family NADH-FMN oxidoreductase RutF
LDPGLYKQVMRWYAAGVMVLTVPDGAGFHAVTVNSVTSVSLQPTLLLVCLENNAHSRELVHAAGAFALSVLSAAQVELGKKFAFDRDARQTPREQAAVQIGKHGGLLFEGALAHLECRVQAEYPGGDHTIFLAEVLEGEVHTRGGAPLVYVQGQWIEINLP